MLIYYLTYLTALIITAGIAIFVYVRNRKNYINQIFFLSVISLFFWTFFNFLTDISKSPEQALLFGKLVLIGPTFAVFIFWYFSTIFPKRYKPLSNFLFALLLIPVAIILALIPTDYNIKSAVIKDGIVLTEVGSLYYFFLLYMVLYFGLGTYNFVKNYRLSKGTYKTQIVYLAIGGILTAFFGGVINIVLPLMGIRNLGGLGSISILFLIGFTTYAVIRYRFLDVKLVIRRRIIYPAILALVVFLYAIIFLYLGNKLAIYFPVINYYIYFAAIFLGALIFNPIKNRISKLIDKYILVSSYNREEIANEADNLLRQSADFNANNKLVVSALRVSMYLKKVIFVAFDKEINNLVAEETDQGEVRQKRFAFSRIITNYLKKHKQVIVYEELEREVEDGKFKGAKLLKELEKINAYVLTPIILNKQLVGVLILGEKQSSDAFTVEDIKMFEDLGYSISQAMESSSLYRQVEKQKEQLKAMDKTKDEFISIASHELRTPMTIIKGYISLILEGKFGGANPQIKDILTKTYASNERLIKLVSDMLDVSKIEQQRMGFDIKPVKVFEIIGSIIGDFRNQAKEKGLKLSSENDYPGLEVLADADKLKQVLVNLLGNAIKYTEKGGIKIKVKPAKQKMAEISVIDTGIGIEKDQIPLLFQKFQQLGGLLGRKVGGTGLGLYISKGLVENMGGQIGLVSKAGKGSIFSFTIPIK